MGDYSRNKRRDSSLGGAAGWGEQFSTIETAKREYNTVGKAKRGDYWHGR